MSSVAFDVAPPPAPAKPQKERRQSKVLRFPGNPVAIPYQEYRNASGRYYMLFYYEGSKRRQECRSSFAELKARAQVIATNIANGQRAMNEFTEADRARWKSCLELSAPLQRSPEQLVAAYVDFRKDLPEGVTDAEVRQFYLDNRPRGYVPRPLPQLVDLFLTAVEGSLSTDWHNHLKHNLGKLAAKFTCPLHSLQSADLNTWLRGLKSPGGAALSPRTRHNYRASVEQLVGWAQANNHLPRTWHEMEHVEDPGQRTAETKILTPEQAIKLLTARKQAEDLGRAEKGFVAFLAMQAFAGIRHEEMNGEKALLDWRDVHLEERYIYVPKNVAKTGLDRTVPISDNLAAWLQPYAKRNGPITKIAQTSGALTKAKKLAGIPAGDNETRNVLRKSFISYRLAVTKSIAQVAEEAGNSPAIIRKHYKRPIPEAEGKRWFDIWPTSADVVQLNFANL